MGPTILLDKSTLQSLKATSAHELSRYFYLNVPPVLISEVLADIEKEPEDARCLGIVRSIARKASPPDSVVNLHYHSLLYSELLGNPQSIPINSRKPIVGGGRSVTSSDGRSGVYFGVQPENEALCRWMAGEFGEQDRKFAQRWREAIEESNLDEYRNSIGSQGVNIESIADLAVVIDELLDLPDVQPTLLDLIMTEIRMSPEVRGWVLHNWRMCDHAVVRDFAPYAHCCLRAKMFIYIGVPQGVVGTRNSNRIDIEYFHYTPFANIFSSGDKLHKSLAPHLMYPDQSFVPRDKLYDELNALAKARESNPHIEPGPGSLIASLWEKHLGRFHPQAQPREATSPERNEQIMSELKPILDAMNQEQAKQPPPPRWPM